MNVSDCSYLSGPNCTFGFPYWVEQCLRQIPGAVRGDYAWAECVLESSTQLEQSIYSERQYLLTLWPAFIGIICGFGPDPSDMVFDNVWWAAMFAITCGGLPGFDSRKPRHHATTDWVDEGRQICESHSESFDPRRSQIIPRSFGRPNQNRVEAIVRMEWIIYSFSWLCYIAFNILFVMALKQSTTYSVIVNTSAGFWYWLSAGPAVLSACAEIFQNRVELYEPLSDRPAESTGTNMNDWLMSTATSKSDVSGPQVVLTAYPKPKGADTTATVAPAVTNPPPGQLLYRRSHHKSALQVWWRIICLQFQRKRYRVLVKPEDDRWFFLLWKLVVGLSRVAVFAEGSNTMGGILLMPEPNDVVLLILLLFLTSIPRMIFFGIWRNKARGADLVVVCNQLAIDQEFLAATRQNILESMGREAVG